MKFRTRERVDGSKYSYRVKDGDDKYIGRDLDIQKVPAHYSDADEIREMFLDYYNYPWIMTDETIYKFVPESYINMYRPFKDLSDEDLYYRVGLSMARLESDYYSDYWDDVVREYVVLSREINRRKDERSIDQGGMDGTTEHELIKIQDISESIDMARRVAGFDYADVEGTRRMKGKYYFPIMDNRYRNRLIGKSDDTEDFELLHDITRTIQGLEDITRASDSVKNYADRIKRVEREDSK